MHDFMSQCLQKNAHLRPSAAELLSHKLVVSAPTERDCIVAEVAVTRAWLAEQRAPPPTPEHGDTVRAPAQRRGAPAVSASRDGSLFSVGGGDTVSSSGTFVVHDSEREGVGGAAAAAALRPNSEAATARAPAFGGTLPAKVSCAAVTGRGVPAARPLTAPARPGGGRATSGAAPASQAEEEAARAWAEEAAGGLVDATVEGRLFAAADAAGLIVSPNLFLRASDLSPMLMITQPKAQYPL